MGRLNDIQSDNKGLTLVELLVTLAVSAVLAAAVSLMIGYSVNTYQNENVNISVQSELQTNVNQIMDAIMSSSGAVIQKKDATTTDYAGFGQFKETYKANGDLDHVDFTGTVFFSGSSGEIYLGRGTGTGGTAKVAVEAVVDPLKTAVAADGRPYLLGQNAQTFWISIDTSTASKCIDSTTSTYKNPLTVNVQLEFKKNGAGKVFEKKVTDNATMRNKVTADIYIDGVRYKLAK